jgi:CRP-like cAMP-binding protein
VAKRAAARAPRRQPLRNDGLSPVLPSIAEAAGALVDLKAVARTVRPGQEIVSEGRRCTAVFLIIKGVAIRYRILRDGQRQILDFLLPGDFAGVRSSFFESALYSTKTLTEAVVAPLPLSLLFGRLDNQPQLAARLLRSVAREAAIDAERLIALGRRSAVERVAHLLLELFSRMKSIGLADERSYRLPLTQEMISDALGLSIPYVNRVLQQLRQDGLVRIKDQVVVIEDFEELAALADFEHTYLNPLSIGELLAGNG